MIVVTALSVPTFNILSSVLLLLLVKPLAALVSASLTNALFNHALRHARAARVADSLSSHFLDGFQFVTLPRPYKHDSSRPVRSLIRRLAPSPLFVAQFLVLVYVFTFGTLCELLFENGTGTLDQPLTQLAFRRALFPSPTITAPDDVRAQLYGLKISTKECANEVGPFVDVQRAWQYNLTHARFDLHRDALNCSAAVTRVAVCAAGQLTDGQRCNASAPVAQALATAGQADASPFGPVHVCDTPLRGDLVQSNSFRGTPSVRFLAGTGSLPVLDIRTDSAPLRGPCPSLAGAQLPAETAPPQQQVPQRGLCSAVQADELFGEDARAIEVCVWHYPTGNLLTGIFDMRNASAVPAESGWSDEVPIIPLRSGLSDALRGVTTVQVDTTGRWVWLPGAQTNASGDLHTALLVMQTALRDPLYPMRQRRRQGGGPGGSESSLDARLTVPERLARHPKAREDMWFLFGFSLLMTATALAVGSEVQPWPADDGSARVGVAVGKWTAATFDIRFALPAFICVAASSIVLGVAYYVRRRRGRHQLADISVQGLIGMWLRSEQSAAVDDDDEDAGRCATEGLRLRPVHASSGGDHHREVYLTVVEDGQSGPALK